MGVRENKVETYLNAEVKSIGGGTRKWVSPGRDGVPDRIVALRGFVAFVEVKTSEGTLSGAQVREHARLRDLGLNVTTVCGESGVDEFIVWMTEHGAAATPPTARLPETMRGARADA